MDWEQFHKDIVEATNLSQREFTAVLQNKTLDADERVVALKAVRKSIQRRIWKFKLRRYSYYMYRYGIILLPILLVVWGFTA